ncbi:MAG: FAD-dependent oxidoreductase [Desulfobulbaceae bacterium]|nr:FAD-dependent oxidoreductase [Desulfobulbaceae bacterium]
MLNTPLCIIGGGPAGVAAACEAAKFGLKSVIVEETDNIGGKVLDHVTKHNPDSNAYKVSKRIKNELKSYENLITIFTKSKVWNIESNYLVSISNASKIKDKSQKIPDIIAAEKIIIAQGALERVYPCPGWTLPGFMTLGAANTFVSKGVIPGKRMLIAGSGPLLILLAANLLYAGVEIAAIVQTSSFRDIFKQTFALFYGTFPHKSPFAFKTAINIIKSRVKIINSSFVTGFDDEGTVSLSLIDSKTGKINTNAQQIFQVDALACSYGLIPNIDIARLAGCWSWYDSKRGYWRIGVNEHSETSLPGIFAAGDCEIVRGYDAAETHGRLAAISVLDQFQLLKPEVAEKKKQFLKKNMVKHNILSKALDSLSRPKFEFDKLSIPSDTCICRCEEVTFAEIQDALSKGGADINDIKRRTRAGMGHCQGRFCGQSLDLVLKGMDKSYNSKELFTPRSPIRPVSFEDIAR